MILLGRYAFDGPHQSLNSLKDEAGVFVVVCEHAGKLRLLDIDESSRIRTALSKHKNESCWAENCPVGQIKYAAYYSGRLPSAKRREIVNELRGQYEVPCD